MSRRFATLLGFAFILLAAIAVQAQAVRVVTEQLPLVARYSDGAVVGDGTLAYLDTTLNAAGGASQVDMSSVVADALEQAKG